jgi:hypothetical protein
MAADPRLLNAFKNFRLSANSAAIDAGTNVGAPTIDYAGHPRPVDGDGDGPAITDIGGFEFQPRSSAPRRRRE